MQQEKYKDALLVIDSAVRLTPNQQGAHYVRGQVLARLGRREEAQAEFATAKKIISADLGKRREALSDERIPNPELAELPPH